MRDGVILVAQLSEISGAKFQYIYDMENSLLNRSIEFVKKNKNVKNSLLKNKDILLAASKKEGSYDPDKIMYLYEESLSYNDNLIAYAFLYWINKYNSSFISYIGLINDGVYNKAVEKFINSIDTLSITESGDEWFNEDEYLQDDAIIAADKSEELKNIEFEEEEEDFPTFDQFRFNENVMLKRPKGNSFDVTKSEKSISARLEPLFHHMDGMDFETLKNKFKSILEDPTTHASDQTRKKWLDTLKTITGKNRLMGVLSNLYLAGANMKVESINFDLNQHLMSIRSNGQEMGHIEIEDGKIITNGIIGENTYDNFVELIKGLQGFNIKVDDFYF